MNYLLSIAIPTFNRYKYLKELIEQLLFQYQKIDKLKIEILIVDNASTDETRNYLTEISSTDFFYYRNQKNIGADANFIECVKKSKGNYVWLLGDDEKLENNALKTIIEILEKDNPSLIITLDKGYKNKAIYNLKYKNYNEIVNFSAKNNPHFLLAHSLISSNIFKRELFDTDKAMSKLKTNYGHMYAIIEKLKDNGIIVIPETFIIIVRDERPQFADKLTNLTLKQAIYLITIGNIYQNNIVKLFALRFLLGRFCKAGLRKITKIPNKIHRHINKHILKRNVV